MLRVPNLKDVPKRDVLSIEGKFRVASYSSITLLLKTGSGWGKLLLEKPRSDKLHFGRILKL